MKNIDKYIIEKILINKNTKIDNMLAKNIIKLLYMPKLTDKQKTEVENIVNKWIDDNNINSIDDLMSCCDKETLNDLPISNQEKKTYYDDYSLNETCQEELTHAKYIATYKYSNNEIYELYASDNMICNLSSFGTIYIIIKTEFD